MRIRLKYLKFHNFLSFEDGEVNLNSSGYTLVQGTNNNLSDMAISNGSGKSSIFEAVSWCITGELIRGSKNVKRLNSNDKDPCWVSLEFDIDDVKYGICRQSNPAKLQLIVDGKDISGKGIRDTEKILQEYLPNLNSQLLGSVIILGQGLPQRFSNNTPSGRKEVLEKLSNSDAMLYDLKDRVAKRFSVLSEDLRGLEDSLIKVTTQKEMCERNLANIKSDLANLPDIESLINQIKGTEEALKNNQLQSDAISKEIDSLFLEKDLISNQLSALDAEYKKSIKDQTEPLDKEIEEIYQKKVEYSTLIKSKTQEISRLKNVKDTCPTCGQKLPGVEKMDTSDLELEVFKIKENLKAIEIKESEINDKITNITLVIQNDYESKIFDLNNRYNDISNQLSNRKTTLNQFQRTIEDQIATLSKLEAQKENRDSNQKSLEDKLRSTENTITECINQILYINNNKEELQKHIDIINKMKTVLTRDFRGCLLSSVIDFINRKAKEYSQEVFGTDKIDFSLNGNNIDICYDNKEYGNLSGGERQKIDLIIQFAIRDMLCKYLDFSSNILVIDELFDNLDSIGCEKILNLISNKLSDVENIYIITHHADIPIPFDNILTVIKGEDGISRLN